MEPDSSSCSRCSEVHTGCGGHEPEKDALGDNTGFWRPCRLRPKAGDLMCKKHTFPEPEGLSAGRLILARHHRPMGNVLEELKALFEETKALHDDFMSQVQGDHFDSKERVVVMKMIDSLRDTGMAIAKMNIDDRLTAIEERKAAAVIALVVRVLGELGLPADTLRLAQKNMSSQMVAIMAPSSVKTPV